MNRLVAVFLCVVPAILAQTNAGSITGTVTDQQQAVVAGVAITVTNLATNVKQSAVSSSAGVYSIPALEPGSYRLTAELTGFKKLVQEPIPVETARSVTIDLELPVGTTTTEVTVTTEAPMVQQSNATVQYTINSKQIEELPLANQSALTSNVTAARSCR